MRPLILLALLAACAAPVAQAPNPTLLVAAGSHPLDGALLDARGNPVSQAELAAALAQADIAILGEIHDNALHHTRQADLVRQIAPRGIAYEMVPEGSEEGVQALLADGGTPGEIGPAIGWGPLRLARLGDLSPGVRSGGGRLCRGGRGGHHRPAPRDW